MRGREGRGDICTIDIEVCVPGVVEAGIFELLCRVQEFLLANVAAEGIPGLEAGGGETAGCAVFGDERSGGACVQL